MSAERYATSIFCDDVRMETGNKMSYMGIYQGNMYLKSFPAVLPRFCISVKAITPATNPFESVKFKILLNNNLIAEQEVSEDILIQNKELALADKDTRDDNKMFIAGAVIQLQPFVIEEPSKLQVRVESESEELKALGLIISQTPPSMILN